MYSNRLTGPLSPPSSPRMSGKDQKPADSVWNATPSQHPTFFPGALAQPHLRLQYSSSPYHIAQGQQHSQPHASGDSAHAPGGLNSPPSTSSSVQAYSAQVQRGGRPDRDVESSTQSRATAQSGHGDGPPQQSPEDDDHSDAGDEEDDDEEGDDPDETKEEQPKRELTAAEIRHQKRKMKRFRLTHNQTRFLMSEFSRQAHPDAAHRERLSREIPGLSPRQVQVWFQNRRAKLKRLNVEDRERMMRSRALPDHFGIAMQPGQQYSASGPTMPAASEVGQSPVSQRAGNLRPLSLDTLRRAGPEHGFISPTGLAGPLSSMAFTPPQSASDTQSPISTAPEVSTFGFSQRAMMDSPRRAMFPPTGSSTPGYASGQYQTVRLPGYDRFRRPSGDTVSSPLRSTMSYGSLSSSEGQGQDSRQGSMPGTDPLRNQRDAQRDMPPPSGPYGLGFSYETMAGFQSGVHSPTHPSPSASQAPTAQTTQAPYRPNAQSLGTQPGAYSPYVDYNQSSYTSPHMQQYQGGPFGGAYASPLSTGSYGQHGEQQGQPMLPHLAGQTPHQYSHAAYGGGDNNDGVKTKQEGDDQSNESAEPSGGSY